MVKQIKVFFYVDTGDNTKSAFAAVDADEEISLDKIAEMGSVLESFGFGKKGVCNSIAWELARTGYAEHSCQMGNYEFGVETAYMV